MRHAPPSCWRDEGRSIATRHRYAVSAVLGDVDVDAPRFVPERASRAVGHASRPWRGGRHGANSGERVSFPQAQSRVAGNAKAASPACAHPWRARSGEHVRGDAAEQRVAGAAADHVHDLGRAAGHQLETVEDEAVLARERCEHRAHQRARGVRHPLAQARASDRDPARHLSGASNASSGRTAAPSRASAAASRWSSSSFS
jgi:hypothetical protein